MFLKIYGCKFFIESEDKLYVYKYVVILFILVICEEVYCVWFGLR